MMWASIEKRWTGFGCKVLRHQLAQACATSCIMNVFFMRCDGLSILKACSYILYHTCAFEEPLLFFRNLKFHCQRNHQAWWLRWLRWHETCKLRKKTLVAIRVYLAPPVHSQLLLGKSGVRPLSLHFIPKMCLRELCGLELRIARPHLWCCIFLFLCNLTGCNWASPTNCTANRWACQVRYAWTDEGRSRVIGIAWSAPDCQRWKPKRFLTFHYPFPLSTDSIVLPAHTKPVHCS